MRRGTSVFAMIETAQGLAALDEICAVPGLTGVYVGPADLAISLGHGPIDAWTTPAVLDAMARIQRRRIGGRPGHRRSTPTPVSPERPWPSWAFG